MMNPFIMPRSLITLRQSTSLRSKTGVSLFNVIQNIKFPSTITYKKPIILHDFVRHNSSGKWLNRQNSDQYTSQAKALKLRSRAAFKLLEIDDKFKLFSKKYPQNVLDLGFAPGAWSQVARGRSHKDSIILGVDILPCKPPRGVNAMQANILSRKTHKLIRFFFSRKVELNRHDDLHEEHGYFEHFQEESQLESQNNTALTENIVQQPIDLIMSDMYVPFPQTEGFWSNTTNLPYFRLANTSGIATKDHYSSLDLCDAALIAACDLLKPGGNFICKFYTGKEDTLLEKKFKKVFHKVLRYKPQACRDESKETYMIGMRKRQNVDKVDVFSQ